MKFLEKYGIDEEYVKVTVESCLEDLNEEIEAATGLLPEDLPNNEYNKLINKIIKEFQRQTK